jgi:monofunctional glycosyltransferase
MVKTAEPGYFELNPDSKPVLPLAKRFWQLLLKLLLWFVGISIGWVLLYRLIDPPITYLMIRNGISGAPIEKGWTNLEDMTVNLPYAAIAAEDAGFCKHHGFDMAAINKARKANARGKTLRGGSTISQQTAKNVFLWPNRSYVRKGLEAWFTVLIEMLWPKRRIMEVYLNIAEWGPGVYGAQAAAQYYFDKDADALTRTEAARLVSILPSPKKWSPKTPGKRVQRKARNVRRALGTVRNDFSGCLKP